MQIAWTPRQPLPAIFSTFCRRRILGLRWRLEKFRSWWFDWKYGTDTAAEESLIESGVSSRQARQGNNVYRAFWGSDFIESVERSVADPGQHTFVDIGSGKGKLLLLVARFGFRKVIGIEYARELCRISQVNLMRFCLKTG